MEQFIDDDRVSICLNCAHPHMRTQKNMVVNDAQIWK